MRILQDPQRLAFAINAIAFIVIRVAYTLRWRNMPVKLSRRSVADQILLVFLLPVGTLLIPATWVFSGWLEFTSYTRPSSLGIAGAITMALGVAMFWRTHVELGCGYSGFLRVNDDAPLVTTGLYSRMRHPMYSAIVVYALGQLLLIPNWIAGPSNLLLITCAYLIRVPREEALLAEVYGEQYARYRARTGALLPRWRIREGS